MGNKSLDGVYQEARQVVQVASDHVNHLACDERASHDLATLDADLTD